MTSLANSRSVPSLDGLRALSIALVLIAHSRTSFPQALASPPGMQFLPDAQLGVTIFFVISGFLITYLLLKEEDASGRIHLGRFYIRRAFRIFPPFYAYLAVLGLLWVSGRLLQDWPSFLSAATYTWNYFPAAQGWYLAHVWSLSLEEQFYLFWPACLLMAGRRRALQIALGIISLSPISRIASYFLLPALRSHEGMMLHTRLDTILFGCVLALLWRNTQFQAWLQKLFRPVILIPAALFLFFGSQLVEQRFRGMYALPVGITLNAAIITLLMAYLVQNPRSWAGTILNTKLLRHLGVISYSLYIWQQIYNGPAFDVFPLNLLLAWVTAELSFRLVERPALRLRDYAELKLGLALPDTQPQVGFSEPGMQAAPRRSAAGVA